MSRWRWTSRVSAKHRRVTGLAVAAAVAGGSRPPLRRATPLRPGSRDVADGTRCWSTHQRRGPRRQAEP